MIFTENNKKKCECKPKTDKVIEGLVTDIGLVDTALKEHEVEADIKFAQTNTSVDTKDAVLQSNINQLRSDMGGQDNAILEKIEEINDTLSEMQGLYTSIANLTTRLNTTDGNVSDNKADIDSINDSIATTLIQLQNLESQVNTVAGQINNLVATSVRTNTLNANTATIGEGTLTKVNATNAVIGNIKAGTIEANNVGFGKVKSTEIEAASATIKTLVGLVQIV